MRVLVTGCAGFIGWKVSELLLRDGHSVAGIDSLVNGHDIPLKHWRLSRLEADPRFSFSRLDISHVGALDEAFTNDSFEAVFNLAARAGVRQSVKDPRSYYQSNLTGALNLLEFCRETGVRKFVLASTSSVYGDGQRPFQEDAPTDRPLSPYAASKKAAETLCYAYHRAYGLDVTVLRYFTVYGPAGRPDMAVFRFIASTTEEEPLLLYGDGYQERDFTYVDDIARGTVLALKPVGFNVFNLGSDRPVAIRQVIELVQEIVGKRARILQQPAMPGDVRATWADITRARCFLEWEPKVTLEQGLGQAVAWYQENRTWAREICRQD
jgi:nucleoside-diphosphate-sugar epimerase